MNALHPLPRTSCAALAAILLCLLAVVGCGSPPGPAPTAASSAGEQIDLPPQSADDMVVVDCALPGQVRRLGQMVYLAPRRAVKTTALDCAIRGGEYVSYDRADYVTALQVWMPQAGEGDKVAQTYVGEIYLRGLGGPPRYDLAAEWFEKAAAQNYPRALSNLGFLYEKGLGRPVDPGRALELYSRVSGLKAEMQRAGAENPLPQERTASHVPSGRTGQPPPELQQLKHQLEGARSELAHARLELADRDAAIKREVDALNRDREALSRDRGTLEADFSARKEKMGQELFRREKLLEESLAEAERLKQELARLSRSEEATGRQLAAAEGAGLPSGPEDTGPRIEIIEPAPVATRGVRMVQLREESATRSVTGRVLASAGLERFTFNGAPVATQDDGLFVVQVPVTRSRELAVEFAALDRRGRSATYRLLIAVSAEKKIRIRPEDFGVYHALVIGNNAYRHLPRLSTAVSDARGIAELLQRKYGFRVELLLDATRYDILAALNRYRKNLTQQDNLLIYYAGHGELVEENQRGYWLPVDADSDSDVNWLPNYQVTDILNITAATQVLVVADTCYAGAMTRSTHARLESGKTAEEQYNWLRTIAQKRSRRVITSGELKPILDSGGGGHSVFAGALLRALSGNDTVMEGLLLYRQLAELVTSSSERLGLKQVPQYAALIHAGHETGDFLFVPASN
jgi:hypothetical protein